MTVRVRVIPCLVVAEGRLDLAAPFRLAEWG
jgi:imidazole glycerol phosphate synthase subunit HisF